MKSIYYREQKHICGKSYATAPYMEVDLYPVTPKQHKASRRAKRKEASTLAQQTYNDNRAKRYHVQLVNANFGKGDFSWTGTYDDDHHPEPGDTAKAERKYPGYTLNRVETRVSNAGWRHTTVIMRRAECWHGTPGRKVTPRMNR